MREENKLKQKQETENNRKLRLVKSWCCPDCLPEAFKGKVTEVYTCSSCVNVNES